jgi:hypothetical protein
MATYEKRKLSADSDGSGVWLGLDSAEITIHTTGTSSSVLDEVWLYFSNNDPDIEVPCYVRIGTSNGISFNIPANSGLYLILPGIIMSGTGSAGSVLTAENTFTSGTVSVFGYVNRITP